MPHAVRAFALSLALTGLFAGAARAAPTSVKVSWASEDASTTSAFTWVTAANAPTVIEYGINTVSENTLTGTPPQELAGVGWIHEIELSGLLPNTTYRYRVGAPGDFSPEYTFRTAPANRCEPFTFVALGDARSQNNRGPSLNWSSIHQEAEAAGARFFLNGGDLVREGNDIAQWASWLADSDAVNPRIPMMPCIGNHDDGPGDGESANYNKLFALPRNTVTGTEDYYAFVYNNLLVFSLSTQTFDDWQAQMTWLRGVAAQHPDKWKVVYFHHPVYTTQTTIVVDVGHPPNEKGQNPYYGPAFDEAGIDVVIQSHNHIYERFLPLRYDASDPEQGQVVANYGNGPNDGRLYIVTGGAGAFLDPLIESNFIDHANGSEGRSRDHHFLKFAIAGNTMQMSAIRTSAGNTSGGGTVIETVTIARPGPDPCAQPNDPDADADGYPVSRDCNDGDPAINPGAAEVCGNPLDEDCSGAADECPMPPVDADNDGSPAGTDCDDANPARFPENPEVDCDNIDNNCDCLEACPPAQPRDLCTAPPPDAGVSSDAAPAGDASTPADSGQPIPPLPDDAGTTSDSGSPDLTTIDDGCSCRSSAKENGLEWAFVLLLAALVVRRSVK